MLRFFHMMLFVHEKTRLSIITGPCFVFCLISRAPGEECEGNAFGSVCLIVLCLSGRVTQKLLLRLSWIFYTKSIMHVARSTSPERESRIYLRILHYLEIGQHMPSKYTMM